MHTISNTLFHCRKQHLQREKSMTHWHFDETSKGWTSFFDYVPNQIFSLNNNYFTAKDGKIYQHYTLSAEYTSQRSVLWGSK